MEHIKIMNEAIKRGIKYNHETGNIIGMKGNILRSKNFAGYILLSIRVENKNYTILGHRFAFYYYYGKMPGECIDHINGIKDDNRIINLRNIHIKHNYYNFNKAKGYYYKKTHNKWESTIRVDGTKIFLGHFNRQSLLRGRCTTSLFRS